jgi:hypothetical protein
MVFHPGRLELLANLASIKVFHNFFSAMIRGERG